MYRAIAMILTLAACQATTFEPGGETEAECRPHDPAIEPALSRGPADGSATGEIEGAAFAVDVPDDGSGLQEALDQAAITDADALLARRHIEHLSELPYVPSEAAYLPAVQSSPLALDRDELAKLDELGFVISERKQFPTFVDGYARIYHADLPVYISADSILHALHRSFSTMLKRLELWTLRPALLDMLTRMRAELARMAADGRGDPEILADLDVFLTVARALLEVREDDMAGVLPVAGGDPEEVASLIDLALAAEGLGTLDLFGSSRSFDFSQLAPRGHYTQGPGLRTYFRSMMWISRVDFRLVVPTRDGLVLERSQLDAMVTLRYLMDATTLDLWKTIDAVIGALMGEADFMTLPEVDRLLVELGVESLADLQAIDDATLERTLLDGGYGVQRIASHLLTAGLDGTAPLPRSFALLGQRYVVDSHVFSNVVYDRVRDGDVLRMMPDPLDVAYAALGNDEAVRLLEHELRRYPYAADLEAMRVLVDAHDPSWWTDDIYHGWLGTIRALSPRAGDPDTLPSVARTEPWSRRILNTQLASWAELRHDTILYAKQSYTGGGTCEYPDAYVDPYPAFFDALGRVADAGAQMAQAIEPVSPELFGDMRAYFEHLGTVAALLADMARRQLAGEPLTDAQIAFANEAVGTTGGCAGPDDAYGWYARLFLDSRDSVITKPTIADVHTTPFWPPDVPAGYVLHVGTGLPRLMVVTIDSCEGPRAYVGLASSYYEWITDRFERLDDPTWKTTVRVSPPEDVWWMRDLVVRWPTCSQP